MDTKKITNKLTLESIWRFFFSKRICEGLMKINIQNKASRENNLRFEKKWGSHFCLSRENVDLRKSTPMRSIRVQVNVNNSNKRNNFILFVGVTCTKVSHEKFKFGFFFFFQRKIFSTFSVLSGKKESILYLKISR